MLTNAQRPRNERSIMRRPQNETAPCFWHSQNLVLISAALLLTCSSSALFFVHGFASPRSSHRHDVMRSYGRLALYSSHREVDESWSRNESCFGVRRRVKGVLERAKRVVLHATREEKQVESWSRSGSNEETRFGVRRRVKGVLERAKNRTGIRNASEESLLKTNQTSMNIVADSASIGGLGWVDEPSTTVDLKKKNGYRENYSKQDAIFLTASASQNGAKIPLEEVDALLSDVPAAVAPSREPLPFQLPKLTQEQRQLLHAGERVQEQTKMGRDGSGYVVVDVKAPPYVVWECLLDFESYTETIPTVRKVTMLTSTHLKSGYHAEKPFFPINGKQLRHYGTPSLTRAAFTLSKFRLNIAAIHNYRPHPDGHFMVFTLDPDCTNLVLKSAKGIWYTQSNPDNRGEEYTRVWLLCELGVSRALPSFIVDYAAKRAMPRATSWLKPEVEAAANLWLKNGSPLSDTPML